MSQLSDRRRNTQLKTTRLFSLQLAAHDQKFGPKYRAPRSYRWLKWLAFYFPALILAGSPSFKLGRAALKTPPFEVPKSLQLGEVFTLPAAPTSEEDQLVPQVAGRPLVRIDGQTPLYFGAATNPAGFDVSFFYRASDASVRVKLASLVPKFEHPTFPLFVKHVEVSKVEATEADPVKPTNGARPNFSEKENKALGRTDGNVKLRCWKTPAVVPLGVDPLRARSKPRLATLNAAGSGEVAHVSPNGASESVVLLYHGGGVYTRYWGLKETRLRLGEKVSAGQNLGYVALAMNKPANAPPPAAQWSAHFGTSELNTPSLLGLSSRLCDSK